jgi:hypothetical protein
VPPPCCRAVFSGLIGANMNIEELKLAFEYNAETGQIVRAVDAGKRWRKGQLAGSVNGQGYAEVKFHGRVYQAHRIAWAIHYGEQPPEFIDHINRIHDDNRIQNLRPATKSQNGANRTVLSNNKHGVKGCYWVAKYSKWRAQCRVNKRLYCLGYHSDIESAKAAYNEFSAKHFGEFAVAA